MAAAKIRSLMKSWRQRAGLSQLGLAEKVGITRQALNAIEMGRQVPSTALSLGLARILGCRVEDLFELVPQEGLLARWVSNPAAPLPAGNDETRLVMGKVREGWVAHALAGKSPQAAHATGMTPPPGETEILALPLTPRHWLEENLLVAGCAPVLGPLAQRVGMRTPEAGVSWLDANSHRALDLLAEGLVHVAGIHLFDDVKNQDNLDVVKARFGHERMVVTNLVRWRQGLVLGPGNPLGITDIEDLFRSKIKMAWRSPGAGATRLVHRRLKKAGASESDFPRGPVLGNHLDVARAVAFGAADVGVAIESVALAMGLSFIPLSEERFDLVMVADDADQPKKARLLDAMKSPEFRKEANQLGGYDLELLGDLTTLDPLPEKAR
jgi:molybdate-binding protein/DNA-binding XRE family transcriptional regulator